MELGTKDSSWVLGTPHTWQDRKIHYEYWLQKANSPDAEVREEVFNRLVRYTNPWGVHPHSVQAVMQMSPKLRALALANSVNRREGTEYFPPGIPFGPSRRQFWRLLIGYGYGTRGGRCAPDVTAVVRCWIISLRERRGKRDRNEKLENEMIEAALSLLCSFQEGFRWNKKKPLREHTEALHTERHALGKCLVKYPRDTRVRKIMRGFHRQGRGRACLVAYHHRYVLPRPD